MNSQMQALDKAINNKKMFDLVNAYLLQRAYTEVVTEQVDAIVHQILQETPVYTADSHERITEHKYLWLASDADFATTITEASRRERAAGIKPADMPDEQCPALVAKSELTKIEHQIINTSGAPLNMSVQRLISAPHGMDNYRKWLDTVIGAVFKLTNFKPVSLKQA